MSNNGKYGLVSWDEVDTAANERTQRENDKDLFLHLEDGPNKVRILTKPHQFMVHNYKEPGDTGWGFKVMCSKHNGKCVLCDRAEKFRAKGASGDKESKELFSQQKAKKRWLVGVIDRKSDTVKILDISYSIFSSLKELNNEESWGPPETYEINIKVNKKGGATGFYTVLPIEKRPLSASDLELKKKAMEELADKLVSKCQPPSPEDVEKRLESIKKFKEKQGGNRQSSENNRAPERSSNQSQFKETTDDDFDFESENA